MNAIGEFDLELLEDYLDDALSPGQVQHVAHRLAHEPELSLAMHELRAHRVLRAAAWRTLEPSEAAAASVSDRVGAMVRREQRRARAGRVARLGAGMAAAIAVFAAGWSLHSRTAQDHRQLGVVIPAPASHPAQVRPAALEPTGSYRVALVDDSGGIIPVQKFSRVEEARQFAQDLLRYETRREEATHGSAMLVSDHF